MQIVLRFSLILQLILFIAPNKTAYGQCNPTPLFPEPNGYSYKSYSECSDSIIWYFLWNAPGCQNATKFNVYVKPELSSTPFLDVDTITINSFTYVDLPRSNPLSIPEGNFTWKVRAFVDNQWTSWTDEITFSFLPIYVDGLPVIHCPGPCPPLLTSPADNTELDNGCEGLSDKLKWTFEWRACIDATKYNIQISNNSSSPSVFVDSTDIPGTSFVIDRFDTISDQKLNGWTWKVRAFVNGNWGDWSQESSFHVEPIGTDCGTGCTPVLVTPANNDIVDNGCTDNSNEVRWDFNWSDCADATNYHLYVEASNTVLPFIETDTITISEFAFIRGGWIPGDITLTWKVRAMIDGLWGPWSEVKTFTPEPVGTDCMVACTPDLTLPEESSIMDNGCSDLSDKLKWYFDWEDCYGASQYHLIVENIAEGISIVDDENLSLSEFWVNRFDTISNRALENWTWKVRAMVNGTWGDWSETRHFTVEPIGSDCGADCIPVLEFPASESVMDNGCYDFSELRMWEFGWSSCENATAYHLYVKSGSSPAFIDIDTLSNPGYFEAVPDWIYDLTDWTWKVRAQVDGLWGSWSEERTFTVEQPGTDCSQSVVNEKESDNYKILLYPNPFSQELTISFFLQTFSETRIDLFNVMGQRVCQVDHSFRNAGSHSITVGPNIIERLNEGIILVRFTFGETVIDKNVILLAQ